MVTTHFKIRKILFNYVFRHRFEKNETSKFVWDKNDWKISIFYKKQQSKSIKNEIVSDYIFGFEFLIVKTWFRIERI